MKERPLTTYRAKRRFERTPEPAGAEPDAAAAGRFVVQRHRARRLHYDVRLELGGVLVSWAVPKGPTLDPAARHLAVHVEDHPIEYLDFEGVIPAGEYGGGDVIVWDRGTWSPAPGTDPAPALADGDLHVDLDGEKLAGRFVFVRRGGGKDDWLLLHKRDEHAVEGWDPEEHPRSVKSGRTNDEVAADPEALWRSDAPASAAEVHLGPGRAGAIAAAEELGALAALGARGRWRFGGQDLALTNLDKVLFPSREGEPAHTKRDLIRYYAVVAPVLLPYLAARPANLHRYPNGVDHRGFWQKEVRAGRPGVDPSLAQRRRPIQGRPNGTRSSTPRRPWPGPRTTPRSSCTRGRHGWTTCAGRRGRSSTSTLARPPPSPTCSCSPASTAPRSTTWGWSACPR